jgi:DNA-binding MarR family transcriptional regulator
MLAMKPAKEKKTKDSQAPLSVLLAAPLQQLRETVLSNLASLGYPDVRPAHLPVLQNLNGQCLRLTALAALCGVTKQTMGYLVDDLVNLGYVESSKDPTDARAKIITLSDRGRMLEQHRAEILQGIDAEWTRALGAKEMKRLTKLLEKLAKP